MLGRPSCPGCMYSGHPHLETCSESSFMKYRRPRVRLPHPAYRGLDGLLQLIPDNDPLLRLLDEHIARIEKAPGSSHNHQAWPGGYLDHVFECMNIAIELFRLLDTFRELPFTLGDALLVLFLHDIEKPWKHCGKSSILTKKDRVEFRAHLIAEYGIKLTEAQWVAMRTVEGEMDYTPKQRTMNELGAFCHMCDIASARLWHDRPLAKAESWGSRQYHEQTTAETPSS